MTTDHQDDSDVFRAALIEDARERAGEHPDLDTLVDYLTDALDSEADDRVRDHLAACRGCITAVLDLEPLVTPDEVRGAVADLEIESAWRDLQSRIEASKKRASSRARHWAAPLAASLLVATVGLSVWVGQLRQTTADLRQQVAGLSKPQVNPPIVYLDEITRGEPGGVVAELSSDQPFVLLIAVPSTPELFSSYEALLTNGTGKVVWTGSGLELSEEETLRLRLPRALLPEGNYRVQILGAARDLTGDLSEIVVETSLQILDR